MKVEVPHLKNNHQAKVLEHIQLLILMATLKEFGYAFEPLHLTLLPETHGDMETSDKGDLKN